MEKYTLEIIDARTNNALKTGHGREFASKSEAEAQFEQWKKIATEPTQGKDFLLDLYTPDGDLVDTIVTNAAGYKEVVGTDPQSIEYHEGYDKGVWSYERYIYGLRGKRIDTNSKTFQTANTPPAKKSDGFYRGWNAARDAFMDFKQKKEGKGAMA
jgi:hypothetical protein